MYARDARSEGLISLLRSYVPAADEIGAHEAMLELLAAVDSPFDREVFSPGHFTASGFVVSPPLDAVLLVHHRRLERWLQPGGHVDPGDVSAEDAARREIEEETGIGGLERIGRLIDIDVHAIPARHDEPAHRHFDLRFGYRAAQEVPTPADEVRDARWVPFDRVATYDVDESVRRGLAKLRDLLDASPSP
jgi:8-oxo-dGTP pyrophosphatase MutT (NUDIX family)